MPEITTHFGNFAQRTIKMTDNTHERAIIPTIVPLDLAKVEPIPLYDFSTS
jgi:hypothetical protein